MVSSLLWTTLVLAFYLIGRWHVFKKAGEKEYKALIPFYGDFVEWKVVAPASRMGLAWAFLIMSIIATILMFGAYAAAVDVGWLGRDNSLSLSLLIGHFVCGLVLFVLWVIKGYFLIECFNKSFWWVLGYVIAAPIVMCILGFGKSVYMKARSV